MNAGVLIGICSVAATIIAALLQRSWQWQRRRPPKYEQLEHGNIHESDSFSVDEVVKILDLSGSPGGVTPGTPGRSSLTDSYLVRREAEDGNGLVCRYATSGKLTVECVSHRVEQAAGGYDSEHYANRMAVGVSLDHLAKGSLTRIINQVEFTGAFDKPAAEDFETHIERPTKSLTFIILFSPDHLCGVISGHLSASERGRQEEVRGDPPMITDGGKVAYWRIVAKKDQWLPLGARYQLKWTWQASRPAPRTVDAVEGETV
jgi:hypothetical protein